MTSSATFTLLITEEGRFPTFTQVKIPFAVSSDFPTQTDLSGIGLLLKHVINSVWDGKVTLYRDEGDDGIGERLFEASVVVHDADNEELLVEFNATTAKCACLCGLVVTKKMVQTPAVGYAPADGSGARFVFLLGDDANVECCDASTYEEGDHTFWKAREVTPQKANPTPLACGLLRGLIGHSIPLEKDPEDVTNFKQMDE
jgi:hypothetical protein